MIKNEIISEKTARLAQEKGFFMETDQYYYEYLKSEVILGITGKKYTANRKGKVVLSPEIKPVVEHNKFSAPTQAEFQRYLREVHKLDIIPECSIYYKYRVRYVAKLPDGRVQVRYLKRVNSILQFKTYEEALEAGLRLGISLIKIK